VCVCVCVCVYSGTVFSDLSLNLFIFCFKDTRGIFTNVVRQTVMLCIPVCNPLYLTSHHPDQLDMETVLLQTRSDYLSEE